MEKYYIDKIKEYGFLFLEDIDCNPNNNIRRIKISDTQGYLYDTNLNNLIKLKKRNGELTKFFRGNIYTKENICNFIKINNLNYELISFDDNNKGLVYLKCNEHGEYFSCLWASLQKLQKCPTHSRKRFLEKTAHDSYFIKNQIESDLYGVGEYLWIGGEYVNGSSKLDIVDCQGYKYKTSYSNISKNRPHKTNANPYAVHNINNWLIINGIRDIKALECKNSKNVLIECVNGHVINMGLHHIYERKRCPKCSKSGENSHRWKGGITPISHAIRGACFENFEKRILQEQGYRCIFTNSRRTNTHHIKSLNLLLLEAFEEIGIKKISNRYDISHEEYCMLENIMIKKHDGLSGVLINEKLHSLFHSKYGTKNNVSQIFEFKDDLLSGKYDNFLEKNKLSLNFNEEIFEKLKELV